MDRADFRQAYYIKLGAGGKYADSCMKQGIARIGFDLLPLGLLNCPDRDWGAIKRKLQEAQDYKSSGAATMDLNALKHFVESTVDDVWITFHDSQLWWTQLEDPGIYQDEISKYRVLVDGWHNDDRNHHVLFANQLPGNVAKVQRFAGTVCKVENEPDKDDFKLDDLRRLINDKPSDAWLSVSKARDGLTQAVEKGLKRLHWRDFEVLVDLVFRNAGWRHRTSSVGGSMKYADIELQAPITGALYLVQVKEEATIDDFERYAREFPGGSFERLYFVVGRPDEKLLQYPSHSLRGAELILPAKLAGMVVDLGLTDWLLKKIH